MSRVNLVISPRIIFVEESDNMTNLSGLYFLQGNAILFAFAMLVWCCPTTQVTLHRDRRVVAVDDPLVDGVRSDGHSSSLLVSGVGTSVMPSSVGVDTHRQVYNRELDGTRSAGNDVPSGVYNAKHLDSTKSPSVRPSTREIVEKQWGGGPREGAGRRQSVSGNMRTGDTLQKSGAAAGSTSKGTRKNYDESSDRPSEAHGGGGRGMDVIGAIPGEGNIEPSERIENDSPVTGGGIDVDGSVNDVSKQATCEKCKKQRDEELLEQYDPNALMQLRIESIKRRILDKLRMERPPQVNMSSINVPAPLSEGAFIAESEEEVRHHVHQVPSDAEEDYDTSEDYYGKTTRVIITAKAEAPPCPATSMASSCFEFDISGIVRSRIATAELWLYWNGQGSSTSSTNHTLIISQLSGHGLRTSRPILNHHVPASQPAGWITVDIKHTVRRWRSHSRLDQVVKITCPTCDSNDILPFAAEESYRPFAVVRVAEETTSRRRRNVNCDVNTTECCRQIFRIEFQDLGWDWVISPRGFNANYCRGSCASFNSPSLTHTSIMHTARSKNTKYNVPGPCCSPRASGTLSMIYLNEDGQFYTVDMPEMKILSCGCS